MSARDDILAKVRDHTVPEVHLPSLSQEWTTYADLLTRFSELLELVGGRCFSVSTLPEAHDLLLQLEVYQQAQQRCSYVEGVGETNIDLEQITDPHDLQNVDFSVLPGELAVAENGSVWVALEQVLPRTLCFLSQHVALVVPADSLVHNLHEAYDRITVGSGRFAAFVSGPSKTADIEQSLVIGAHGARTLTVFLVGEPKT